MTRPSATATRPVPREAEATASMTQNRARCVWEATRKKTDKTAQPGSTRLTSPAAGVKSPAQELPSMDAGTAVSAVAKDALRSRNSPPSRESTPAMDELPSKTKSRLAQDDQRQMR